MGHPFSRRDSCRTRADWLSWIAGADHHRRKILQNGAAGADHGSASYRDAWADEDACGQPDFRFDDDEAADHVEGWFCVVMVGRGQIAVLRDAGVVADTDFAQRI